jgi:hypothetical protein
MVFDDDGQQWAPSERAPATIDSVGLCAVREDEVTGSKRTIKDDYEI